MSLFPTHPALLVLRTHGTYTPPLEAGELYRGTSLIRKRPPF